MKPIRILLVDDQRNIRRGLRMRLEIEPGMLVVGEAEDGAAALAMATLLAPDVILMDAEMPGMDGITATKQLCETACRCAVIVLTLHDDAGTRARAEAAGAAGFVAKHHIDTTLLDAIRRAGARNAREEMPIAEDASDV
jgi:DNA-binding NarL/FixJ family response regulator